MLLTALLAFVAGLLTAFAPCVLPLLPIILGGSVSADGHRDKWRPYIITGSLVVSLVLFTLLLKASTVLIGVDPRVWTFVSGGLVIALGLFMLFPNLWAKFIGLIGFEHRSQQLLGTAGKTRNRTLSAVLMGAALGPVFSSCSPTYAFVIATVLPANIFLGMLYLAIYCLGVAIALLAIALLGRKLLANIKWASNPNGWFQRSIAVLFILVGFSLITGIDKQIQTYLVEKDPFGLIELEGKLVPPANNPSNTGDVQSNVFNVTPYDAPEIRGVGAWINSEPLRIADLRGKVVLVDFWTYSCINCQRTQPYLNAWYKKYADDGLVIIGMHAPEFAFERVKSNVQRAVDDAGIKYPVALDNDFATWQAYDNQYWPAKYLIDKNGQVRYTHFGEGKYDKTEKAIQALLGESSDMVSSAISEQGGARLGQTPETYLGYQRGSNFANRADFKADKATNYTLQQSLKPNQWTLGGRWTMTAEHSRSESATSQLRIKFSAKEVYLVMDGPKDSKVKVEVDNKIQMRGDDVSASGMVTLDGARLYKLVQSDSFQQNKVLTITVPNGVTLNAFTFGG